MHLPNRADTRIGPVPTTTTRPEIQWKFDHGWDGKRIIIHQRRLQIGVISPGTKLTPRPTKILVGMACRTTLTKTVYRRLMETMPASWPTTTTMSGC